MFENSLEKAIMSVSRGKTEFFYSLEKASKFSKNKL